MVITELALCFRVNDPIEDALRPSPLKERKIQYAVARILNITKITHKG